MAPLKILPIVCLCLTTLGAGEPLLLRTSVEAAASPYDNLRVGVPFFTDCVVDRESFAIGFSKVHRQPLWVQYRLLKAEVETAVTQRSNRFRKDETIPESALPADYAKTGFDRGHMAPAGDMKTNMSPQHPRCNRLMWKFLEDQVRAWGWIEEELYVICGPIFAENSVSIGNGTIRVPVAYFKIVYDATPPEKMIAFFIPNRNCRGNLRSFAVSVEVVEALTGFDFFRNLPEDLLESVITVDAWEWSSR